MQKPCEAGRYCPGGSGRIKCRSTYFCPALSWNETLCSLGYACPTPYMMNPCDSANSFCNEGVTRAADVAPGYYSVKVDPNCTERCLRIDEERCEAG